MEEFRYAVIERNLKKSLVTYLVKFFKDQEPITRSLKLTDRDAEIFFNDLVEESIQYPVSFVAFNENDEIVGCRMNTIYEKNVAAGYEPDLAGYPSGPRKIVQLLDALLLNFQENLPTDFAKIMKFVTVSVHPNYQRRGIAQKMVELSMAKAEEFLCDYIMVTATALRSQQMFEKLGFVCIKRIDYANFLDDHGEVVFDCDDGTMCSKLLVKRLNS